MTEDSPKREPSAYDEYLDRILKGEAVLALLAIDPRLSPTDRRRLERLAREIDASALHPPPPTNPPPNGA